jgi:hypothetical protein
MHAVHVACPAFVAPSQAMFNAGDVCSQQLVVPASLLFELDVSAICLASCSDMGKFM